MQKHAATVAIPVKALRHLMFESGDFADTPVPEHIGDMRWPHHYMKKRDQMAPLNCDRT